MLALLAAGLLANSACGASGADDRAAAVQDVVREYNRLLAVAFADLDMNALAPVATHDQAQIEFYQMAALAEGKVILDAELQSIEFEEISFPADSNARVVTREMWDYRQVSTETSAVIGTQSGVTYHLEYGLVFEGDRWLVDSVTSLDDEGTSQETTAR